jgi:hypothetical protein
MQKMTKLKIILFLIVLLVILLTATYLYLYIKRQEVKRQDRMDQRQHLLCEVLQPGMSKSDILETLGQVGEFTVIGEVEDPGAVLHIVFKDSENLEVYGAFDLDFVNYKYTRAYVTGFDYQELICDFTH